MKRGSGTMKTVRETAEIPILDDFDVLVCGGGMTGFPAAVASARNGARTLLLESGTFLGGTATAGLMGGYPPVFNDGCGNQIVGGIIYEFTERLDREDALPLRSLSPTDGYCKLQFDPEVFKRVAMEMVQEAGVEVMLDSHVGPPLLDGKTVVGATIQTRQDRFAVFGKATVDGTGDGSIAAWSGCPFEEATGGVSTLMFQICRIDLDTTANAMASRMDTSSAREFKAWYDRHGTLSVVIPSDFPDIYEEAVRHGDFPRRPKEMEEGFDMQGIHGLSRNGFAYVFGPLVRGSCLDPRETSRRLISAQKRVWRQMELIRRIPGLEKAAVAQTAPALGVRASRHLHCEYELTPEDLLKGSRFVDAVGQGCRYVPWLEARRRYRGKVYQIPYRALLPLQVEGLLVGGRAVSRGSIRGMVNCAVMGEACGTAAALAAAEGRKPRSLLPGLVQERLRGQGVILGAAD